MQQCNYCDRTSETSFITTLTNTALGPSVDICDDCLEEKKPLIEDGKVGEAGAVFALMGWLTSRDEVSGPFSGRHNAGEGARLAGMFCESQGWDITDDSWHRRLKPYPDGMAPIPGGVGDEQGKASTDTVAPQSGRAKKYAIIDDWTHNAVRIFVSGEEQDPNRTVHIDVFSEKAELGPHVAMRLSDLYAFFDWLARHWPDPREQAEAATDIPRLSCSQCGATENVQVLDFQSLAQGALIICGSCWIERAWKEWTESPIQQEMERYRLADALRTCNKIPRARWDKTVYPFHQILQDSMKAAPANATQVHVHVYPERFEQLSQETIDRIAEEVSKTLARNARRLPSGLVMPPRTKKRNEQETTPNV